MFEEVEVTSDRGREYGLQPTYFPDLSQVVVLAGPNGAGKSRFLNHLEIAARLAQERRSIEHTLRELPNTSQRAARREQTEYWQSKLVEVGRNRLRVPSEHSLALLRSHDVSKVTPTSYDQLSFRDYLALSRLPADVSLTNNTLGMVQFLAGICAIKYQSKHEEHRNSPEVQQGLQDAQAFNTLVRQLLGTEVGYEFRDGAPHPTLFNRRFAFDELSPGQRTLLAWCISLFAQSRTAALTNSAVLAIDEPELHLHPAAHIGILNTVYRSLIEGTNRQLWIATHSPSVVAHFASLGDLFLVENNAAVRAGKRLGRMMDELLGGDDERACLHACLGEAAIREFYVFAAQSLHDALVSSRSDDPQSSQLVALMRTRATNGTRLRVLDYAAGKGRFAEAVAEMSPTASSEVDYVTYDEKNHDTHRDARLRAIQTLYPGEDPSLRSSNELSDYGHDSAVDIVVMANFLHEVPVREWRTHLCNALSALRSGGLLAVLEDQKMRIGELPHQNGFLVAELAEMREYLGAARGVQLEPASNERCTMITIERDVLQRFHDEGDMHPRRLLQMLAKCRQRLLEEIRSARTKTDGVAHARSAIQLANVSLALMDCGAAP